MLTVSVQWFHVDQVFLQKHYSEEVQALHSTDYVITLSSSYKWKVKFVSAQIHTVRDFAAMALFGLVGLVAKIAHFSQFTLDIAL